MKITKIYLDMDGVLADFERGFTDKFGMHPSKVGKDEKNAFKETFGDNKFFLELKKMPKADQLVKLVLATKIPVEILTAIGKTNNKSVIKQKKLWVKKKYPKLGKVNTVLRSNLKGSFATETTVLIDDRKKAYAPFKAAGGQIIPYENENLAEVKKFFDTLEEHKVLSFAEFLSLDMGDPK